MFIEINDGSKNPMLINIDKIESIRELEDGSVIIETDVVANGKQNTYLTNESYTRLKTRMINILAMMKGTRINEFE